MNRPLLLSLSIPLLLSSIGVQNAAEIKTVAEVDGERISLQDVEEASGEPLARLEEQIYRLEQQKLKQMIEDRLLTKETRRRNISLQSLIDTEITSKVAEVTSQEIHSVYELNRNQLQKPESEVEGQLRSVLHDQKVTLRRQEYAESLQAKAKVAVYLEPPPPFRANVSTGGPNRGATDAPVTIVEFEDFQCPFCKKAQDTLEGVLARYNGKVRIVHRDFPLQPLHPAAWKAHEAARCAEKQGKFWQYRSLLYANTPAASLVDLSKYATQLGMDAPGFKQCLDSGEFKAAVQPDADEGDRLGVRGTPAFFINGRLLSGAQPESDFARIIDEELSVQAKP